MLSLINLNSAVHFFTVALEGGFLASTCTLSSWISLDVLPMFFRYFMTTYDTSAPGDGPR